MRQLIEAQGAELFGSWPAYSLDLNPIEEGFSKIKALLKKGPLACARGIGGSDG